MEQIVITRTGERPLRFTGILISEGTNKTPESNRWANVRIYRTKGGKVVVWVERRTQWQGERDNDAAMSFTTAGEAIDWLRKEDGSFGISSQDAIERAAAKDQEFAAAWTEDVE